MTDIDARCEGVVAILEEAAALHQAHMDGTEPTSEASQGKLMGLIDAAIASLNDQMEDEDATPGDDAMPMASAQRSSSTIPRDDLIRMTDLSHSQIRFTRAADADSGILGTLTGYAAVFGVDTVIDSWEGRFTERIAPGAFTKTLAERGDRIKVLFNHGFDPSIGDKPLGKPEIMREDKIGLFVSVPLDDTSYNRDLVASLRSGALDGQSFRFSVKREEWEVAGEEADLPSRILREVALYEFGPVTFPAYEATTAGVRAREAYLAWRTAHSTASPTPDAAQPGTSGTIDSAAQPGTLSHGKPIRAVAVALQRARRAGVVLMT